MYSDKYMSSVVFNISEFRGLFAQFASDSIMSDTTLEMYFDMAVARYKNDDTSVFPYAPERDIKTRKYALYFYTCHIATLALWSQNGQNGRLASASQGSVSTSFDLIKSNKPSVDWFLQTPCGTQFYLQFLKPLIAGGRIYNNAHYHPWN